MKIYLTQAQLTRELQRAPATVALRVLRQELRPDATDLMGSMYLFDSDRLDEIKKLFARPHVDPAIAEIDAALAQPKEAEVIS